MTSHVEITHDLYKWLVQYQILPNTQKYKPSGNFQLEYRYQQQLQCGFLVAKLLNTLAAERGVTLNAPLMSSIKNSNTPAARVYNWNILNESALKLGISLSKEKQKEITSGNFDSLVHILLEIQNKTNPKKLQKSNITQTPQVGLDIKKVRKYQQIQESESVLEFIIILISKNLGLTSKQAVATLAESAKYLAHMIVKGVKNSFEEVVAFIEDSQKRMDKIMYLAERDAQKNIQFLLQIFKPTLISREPDVAKAGAFLFKALVYQSCKYNSKNIIYQILCKQGEGFDFIYMGFKRHPYLNYEFFQFLHPLIQNLIRDFFEIQLKKTINNEQQLLKTIILILQPLLENKEAKAEVFEGGLFSLWEKNYDHNVTAKLKGKDMIAINEETKVLYIQLLYTLFLGYYKQMEPDRAQEMLMKLTEQLKKNTRSQIYTIRIPSLLKIFNVLEFLAKNKNKLAALLYKKIIFLFVENHNQDEMRQIVLQNLTIIIKKFPTIPLQFLLQPMLKQLTNKQGTSYILNMFDFQFVVQLCKHPKMQQYYAITFLDYFIKLYTKSVIYSSLIFRVIEVITDRFCESEQIREYCLRSTDSSLNVYGMLVMGKSKGNKAMYVKDKSLNKEQAIINNQKKSLIIELIKHFVKLEHKQLTQQIKQRVISLFLEWYENRNHYDKGLASILMEIGDVEGMIIEYKQKQAQKEEMEEQMRKQKIVENGNSNDFNGDQATSRLTQLKGLDRSQIQRKEQILKYYNDYDISDKGSPILQDIGLSYKKKRNLPNKYQVLPSRSKAIKPDPKVLEDIEKIKQKWRLDQSRAKLQQQVKKQKTTRLNEKQLLQRNISLGYSKLPQLNNDQILFDIDSVKKRHLKDTLDLIDLQVEQDRELKSFENIKQRYQKYLKTLFARYASKSGAMGQSKQDNILSFTQIMRMLKEKGLLAKIPKIAINELITTINQKRKKQKNVLGGIYEQDFPTFILYFTDLVLQQDTNNKKDEPFGMKVQKVILKMLEGENNVKQLFDPKIQKMKQDLEYDQNIVIPSDYKKVKEVQIDLEYRIKNRGNFNIDSSFMACYQILDGLVYEAVGMHIVTPFTDFIEKTTLTRTNKPLGIAVKKHSQSMDRNNKIVRSGTEIGESDHSINKKNLLNDSQNSFTKPLKKITKNLLKYKAQSQSHQVLKKQKDIQKQKQAEALEKEKDKKRQLHAKKLKEQIQKMREQKQKAEHEKKEKQKVQQEKVKKKEQERQQYLEQNKKKIKQKKQEEEAKRKQAEKMEKQKEEKRKAEMKAKQTQLVEREKKVLKQKRDKIVQKLKQKEQKQRDREKLNKSKSHEKILNQMKTSAADQKNKELLIKNSLQNGDIKGMVEKYRKNFEDLFQTYWNWEKQKMELKNLAEVLRDFETTKYISPKDIADVYKNVAKGQLLELKNFIQCIVKLAYRSSAIEEQTKQAPPPVNNQKEKANQNPQLNLAPFEFMLKLLKMNEPNYKQFVSKQRADKALK